MEDGTTTICIFVGTIAVAVVAVLSVVPTWVVYLIVFAVVVAASGGMLIMAWISQQFSAVLVEKTRIQIQTTTCELSQMRNCLQVVLVL